MMIKQGRDARQQFQAAGRDELAAKEAAEIAIFERYLPQPLAADELQALIADAVAGAQGMQDMGRIMAAIKAQAAGRCDMAEVGKRVREILASL
jgi:uncharacterized protein YqeY